MKKLEFKRVVVASIMFPTRREEITQTMFAEYPEKENDLRKSGGYSDIGIQDAIDKNWTFYLQEMEYPTVISEIKIENPTVELIRELDYFPRNLKQW